MRFAAPLSDRAFAHRLNAIVGTLAAYGELLPPQDEVRPGSRRLRIELAIPGYGLPVEARLLFVEHFQRMRGGWRNALYAYEYQQEPRPAGRKAYHWHDGSYHIHCVDPRRPGAEHYRGFPVDALEVSREFAEIHAAGQVSCAGLYSLE